MAAAVYTKTLPPPPVQKKEILRYAGAVSARDPMLDTLAEACLEEALRQLTYRVCWQEFPISLQGEALDLGFAKTASVHLKKNLTGCDGIVLFAATVGLGLDRLIARYTRLSPAKALLFQAIGAERIEALCNAFNQEITQQQASLGRHTVPRFSPGYGDLPLSLQRDIFQVLDCPRKIGVTLNESLLMSPSKSVTAIIGIGPGRGDCRTPSGCETCLMTNCPSRRIP